MLEGDYRESPAAARLLSTVAGLTAPGVSFQDLGDFHPLPLSDMLSRIATDPWPCIDFICSEPRMGMNGLDIMDVEFSLGFVRNISPLTPASHYAAAFEGAIRHVVPFMSIRGSEYFCLSKSRRSLPAV